MIVFPVFHIRISELSVLCYLRCPAIYIPNYILHLAICFNEGITNIRTQLTNFHKHNISGLGDLPTHSIVCSSELGTPCPVSWKQAFSTANLTFKDMNSESVLKPFSVQISSTVCSISTGGSQGLFGRRNLQLFKIHD